MVRSMLLALLVYMVNPADAARQTENITMGGIPSLLLGGSLLDAGLLVLLELDDMVGNCSWCLSMDSACSQCDKEMNRKNEGTIN